MFRDSVPYVRFDPMVQAIDRSDRQKQTTLSDKEHTMHKYMVVV